MIIKRNIKFDLHIRSINGEKPTANLPIRMRVTYAGNRMEISLPLRVDLSQWDEDNERMFPKLKNPQGWTSKKVNGHLEEYFAFMEEAFSRFEVIEKKIPEPKQLRSVFNELSGRKKDKKSSDQENEVGHFLNEFIREHISSWAEGTLKKIRTFQKILFEYRATISFDDIDSKFLNEFTTFLCDEKKYTNSTTKKHIRIMKTFLNWATNKDYNTNLEYKKFKLKLKTITKPVIFLTWNELMHLYNMEIKDPKLDRTRDIFCFSCFTSLRYSDVFNLRRSNITDKTISIVTVKTADPLIIDLNDYSKSILNKYKDIHHQHNKALPVISNQKMNDQLKELGKLAGFDTPVHLSYYKGNERIDEVLPKYSLLSTHCGRRTFICNALALGIPAHVVMKWTGHSDYKAMEPYIAIADDTKAKSMKKFNQKEGEKKPETGVLK